MRRRTRILGAIALVLVVANVLITFLNWPKNDYSGDEVALWFGSGREPMASYISRGGQWPMLRRPMVVLDHTGATRQGRRVAFTDMVDNIGRDDFAREMARCFDGCIGGPWFAFARADPTATMATITRAITAVRARCKIEIVVFDGFAPDAHGFAVFLARGRDVPKLSESGSFPNIVDPTLLSRREGETSEHYWDRTGCPVLNPRRP